MAENESVKRVFFDGKEDKYANAWVSVHLIFGDKHPITLPRPSQGHTFFELLVDAKHQKALLVVPHAECHLTLPLPLFVRFHISLSPIKLYRNFLIVGTDADVICSLSLRLPNRRAETKGLRNISKQSRDKRATCSEIAHHEPSVVVFSLSIEGNQLCPYG